MNNTGIIILAAGNASRFGKIKQLLHFNNKTLLQHVIDEATDAGAEPIIVITGANADEVSNVIEKQKVQIAFNENWQQGMASGIAAGISKIISLNNHIENVIIAVCDQPFISAGLFQQLIDKKSQTGKGVIACSYADTIGTPVLFTHKYFDELMSLRGDEGAKKLLKIYEDDVATIDFPQGNIDIDTKEDYDELLDKQEHAL